MLYESDGNAVGAVKQHLRLLPLVEGKTPIVQGH